MTGYPRGCASRAVQFHPMGVNSISFGPPHIRPMWALSACGEPNEIKKNTHPKNLPALCHGQVHRTWNAVQAVCKEECTRDQSPGLPKCQTMQPQWGTQCLARLRKRSKRSKHESEGRPFLDFAG